MIHLLAPDVRDQIAAGEVVERPAHMIKELVENSLDAGATEISIRVEQGGRRVEIQDNGCGIPQNELWLALERFATSKIQVSEDLWKLKTYGFRGEALASLAAVSELTLTSRTANSSSAARIHSHFGQNSDVDQISGELGTQILIEDLFENLPARLKFLKSESAENQAIKQIVKAMALSHPHVEFRYFEGSDLVLFYPRVDTARLRSEQVLEISGLFQAQDQSEAWQVDLHFSSPEKVAKTSKNIWIFVQNRFVQDRALQTAIMDAYRSLLMHGEYPICVLHLKVPEDQVDVNIHPTKSQVKFLEPSKAFRFVHHTLRDELIKAPWRQHSFDSQPLVTRPEDSAPVQNFSFQDPQLHNTVYRKKDVEWTAPVKMQDLQRATDRPPAYWSSYEVIGQVGLTYIVAQNEDKLLLIDQHAAHERVAFEKLMAAWQGGYNEVQEFLFPLALDMSSEKMEALLKHEGDMEKLGVHFEILGPSTLGVRSAPAFVKDSVFAEILEKMADEILEKGGSFVFEKKVVDICATMACHSVVRAGQALSLEEMKSLLIQMDEFPLSSFCPHGRPVSIEWSYHWIEKEFGRRN